MNKKPSISHTKNGDGMEGLLFVIIGYFFGCFQSAYIISKLLYKTDIRTLGSGNAGTSNALRVYGKRTALLVLFCDMMKTIIACILCVLIAGKTDSLVAISLASLGVAAGHNFPFWLRFKGGKGVAVAVAAMLVLDVRIFLISLVMAGVFSFFTKSLTYGSYTYAVMMFVSCAVFGYEAIIVASVLLQSVMIWVLHFKRTAPLKSTI